MFNIFESSIDSIVKQFTKAIDKLEAHSAKHEAKARQHVLDANESMVKSSVSWSEVQRADAIKTKIEGMIA